MIFNRLVASFYLRTDIAYLLVLLTSLLLLFLLLSFMLVTGGK